MIKIEGKGNIVKAAITGDEVTVLSELTYAVKHIHREIEKVRGKKWQIKRWKMYLNWRL